MSLRINNASGRSGRVEISGLRAVVADFTFWSLTRLEETQSGMPVWSLRAVCAYHKDSFIKSDRFAKKIFLVVDKTKEYEARTLDGAQIEVDGDDIRIAGVTLWPVG